MGVDKATIEYRLPIPPDNKKRQVLALPFINQSGTGGIKGKGRTFKVVFNIIIS
jgi:hypothetical protein